MNNKELKIKNSKFKIVLKDLAKKVFAFSLIDIKLLEKLK